LNGFFGKRTMKEFQSYLKGIEIGIGDKVAFIYTKLNPDNN
jgi:DNA-directed RNA polymerase delta subunit